MIRLRSTGANLSTYPFEVSYDQIYKNPDPYVDAVFSCLGSEFLVMPKGDGFVEYPLFERGYEALKIATDSFTEIEPKRILPVTVSKPISIVVLRSMLGFTPPEWGYVTTQNTGINVTQGFIRALDRNVRLTPESELKPNCETKERLNAMIQTACQLLKAKIPDTPDNQLHRLDKADTRQGVEDIQNLSIMGVPYAMLLYERFLGRPFAGHRDSVSELIGGSLESAIEDVLVQAGISYRKTGRAERIEGFDQVPDFMIPSEYSPVVIIEAKITEDDGTARDKVTRIQHLGELSVAGSSADKPKFEVVACIGGRGFGVRREDMKKLITATRGKVFTANTLDQLVDCTRLREFKSR